MMATTAITIRGDGHYWAPEVLSLLRLDCDSIIGLPSYATLAALVAPWHQHMP